MPSNDRSQRTTSADQATHAPTENAGNEVGADQVQATVDEEEAKGYIGDVVDPTPNEAYTVGGVSKGMPTPETDIDARDEATRRVGPFRHRSQ